VDSSPYGHSATLSGATWTSSGKIDGALDFDGTDDYVVITEPTSGPDLDFESSYTGTTIACWVKVDQGESDDMRIIEKVYYDPNEEDGYTVKMNNGQITFTTYANGSELSVTDNTMVNDGGWHHIAVTRDVASTSYTLKLYIDGVEENYVTTSGTARELNNAIPLRIGSSTESTPSKFFDGLIDDVRIYYRYLYDNEIETLAGM
jgi:hypothetical protein